MKQSLFARAALAAIAGGTAVAVDALPAHADAEGCTFGPNNTQVCVIVRGEVGRSGKYVRYSDAAINSWLAGPWTTLCRTQSKWTYRRDGYSTNGARYSSYRAGCVYSRAYFTWDAQANFANGSNFCGTTRADQTGDAYPQPACIEIKG